MDIHSLTKAPLLVLGSYDADKVFDKKAYLQKCQSDMKVASKFKDYQFKDEQYGKWRPFTAVQGQYVNTLQTFLHQAGFMPNHQPDGIFGYETLSSLRLFQEYMRTMKGKSNIMPDGLAGQGTFKEMIAWQDNNEGVCEWSTGTVTPAYTKWLKLLTDRKAHFLNRPNAVFSCRENYTGRTDTRKIADWDVSADTAHLIGIRRNQKNGYKTFSNDYDVFVFLINGMAFYFFGATVPNRRLSNNKAPFILEGQHHYHLSWHHWTDELQIYQAWKPATVGVLAIRETPQQEAVDVIHDATKMQSLLDNTPNTTINIHWSGRGSSNYSAGCQVIGGASYVNNKGEIIDDGILAASGKHELHKVISSTYTGQKTKAAFNVLKDLFLTYRPGGVNSLAYSVLREEMISTLENWPQAAAEISNFETKMRADIRYS